MRTSRNACHERGAVPAAGAGPTLPYTLPSVKRPLSYAADAEGRVTDPPLQIHWE